MKENIAVREANRLGIPVFGIVDKEPLQGSTFF